jgi:hypothetical protein
MPRRLTLLGRKNRDVPTEPSEGYKRALRASSQTNNGIADVDPRTLSPKPIGPNFAGYAGPAADNDIV